MKKTVLCLFLAAVLCSASIGAHAILEGGEDALYLHAGGEGALTAQDFSYFVDTQSVSGDDPQWELRIPGPEAVKQRFGEPDSEEAEAGSVRMYYPFGWVILERNADTYWGIEVLISTDGLEGPRGLRIGDTVEALLAAFRNEDAGLPAQVAEEGEIVLFLLEPADGPASQHGYAVYRGADISKELVTIEYGFTCEGGESCRVSFEVGGGSISQIRWRAGDYQY